MTISEELFENFCVDQGIPCDRVREGEQRQPDYIICPCGQTVIVEIKQFDPTPEEEELARQLDEKKSILVNKSPPGRRVRTAIQSGYPQLKALGKGRYPTILLLFNNVIVADHADPYDIKTGMFGLEVVDMVVPHDTQRSPYAAERRFGGKRRVTPGERKSLSSVAVLFHRREGNALMVFHNPFAALPLPVECLSGPNFFHYRIEEKSPGHFQDWVAVTS